jgi:hypothetical protein
MANILYQSQYRILKKNQVYNHRREQEERQHFGASWGGSGFNADPNPDPDLGQTLPSQKVVF